MYEYRQECYLHPKSPNNCLKTVFINIIFEKIYNFHKSILANLYKQFNSEQFVDNVYISSENGVYLYCEKELQAQEKVNKQGYYKIIVKHVDKNFVIFVFNQLSIFYAIIFV